MSDIIEFPKQNNENWLYRDPGENSNYKELSEEKNNDKIKCNKCNKEDDKNKFIVICKLCKICRDKNKKYKNKNKKSDDKPEENPNKNNKNNDKIIKINVKKLLLLLDNYKIENKDKFLNDLII